MPLVKLNEDTRDKLRVYKAKHGETYTEAVERLFENIEWEYNE